MELRPSEAGRATSRGELRQERQYRVGVGTVGEPGERKEPAMPEPTYALYVGVDWGNQTHQVAVLDTARGLRGERVGAHDGPGLHALASWLAELAAPGTVAVAIEVPHGAVVDTLLERGFAVYALNPRPMDRFRDRDTVAGAKDDRRDAQVLAAALLTIGRPFGGCTSTIPRWCSCASSRGSRPN